LGVAGGFTLTNAAGGSIQIEGGSGGARTMSGRIVNAGLIDVAAEVDRSNAVVYQSSFEAAGGRIQGGLYFYATLLQLDAGQPAQGQSYILVGSSNRLVG